MKITDPYYACVPKSLAENLAYRDRLIREATADPARAQETWIACRRSVLFWINTFCWGFDPRTKTARPFITHPYQDEIIPRMRSLLGKEDIGAEKSRDVGWTWKVLLLLTHSWLYDEYVSYLLISRKADLVDAADDPDTLFWKIDWTLKRQPGFLLPQFNRTYMNLANLDAGNTMVGTSTTSDAGVGGRKTAVFADELAAAEEGQDILARTQFTTDCRIGISTPRGAVGGYYDFMQTVHNKFTTHWSQHPEKIHGLYTIEGGYVKILDPRYEGWSVEKALADPAGPWREYDNERWQFRPRMDAATANAWGVCSPWYDYQCDRAPSLEYVAQELDINYHGSDYPFFDLRVIDERLRAACEPYHRGEVAYELRGGDLVVKGWSEEAGGRVLLWSQLDEKLRPLQDGGLVMACDVSAGTGASNSTIVVQNTQTREKILEYANPLVADYEFACIAVAIARWMGNPLMIWEAQGPGVPFGKSVVRRLRYTNVYWLPKEIEKKPEEARGGWYSTVEGKNAMLYDYALELKQETFVDRSRVALDEHRYYVRTPGGKIVHRKSVTKDPSGAGSAHGDRVIAAALCILAQGGMGAPPIRAPRPVAPFNSTAGRMEREKAKQREEYTRNF